MEVADILITSQNMGDKLGLVAIPAPLITVYRRNSCVFFVTSAQDTVMSRCPEQTGYHAEPAADQAGAQRSAAHILQQQGWSGSKFMSVEIDG
eukprot:1154034-Pelagomonas_calceolata.AAC.3